MQQLEDVYRATGKAAGALPAASPTSVLEENPSDYFMADWSWETSPPPPPVAATSSIPGASPLRSPSSSNDAEMQQQQLNSRPATGAEGNRKTTTRSLVETLQNCLTSLPQSTTDTTPTASSSSKQQFASRPPGKRRPRASRRTPTTILETDASEFRDMVQKLTGIPSVTQAPGATAPVRPRPQRANPSSSFIRPETLRSIRRLPPMAPTPRPPPPLPSPLPPFLQHLLSRTPTSKLPGIINPTFGRSCKREFDNTEDQELYSPPSMKRVMSEPTTSMQSWWEQDSESRNSISMSTDFANSPLKFSMSCSDSFNDSLAKESNDLLMTSGITMSSEYARIDSADGQLAQEEEEFNFESWLSAESMHG